MHLIVLLLGWKVMEVIQGIKCKSTMFVNKTMEIPKIWHYHIFSFAKDWATIVL